MTSRFLSNQLSTNSYSPERRPLLRRARSADEGQWLVAGSHGRKYVEFTPQPVGRKVWKPKRGCDVVAQVVSVVADDEKYPNVEQVVVSVRVPKMVAATVAPWVVSTCERPPAGWTHLPWWKDGVALQPDFGSVAGPDVMVVGPGKPLPKFQRYATWTHARVIARCVKPNPSPMLVKEYKKRFGRALAPQYKPAAQLVVLDEPVASQIENASGRVLDCKWETYEVPNLEGVGYEGVMTPGDLGQLHSWLFTMVDKGSVKEVTVPAGLVDKLGEFWAYKEKDAGHANFLVSVEKLRNLLRPLVVTAHQSRVAMMYVPVVAYKRFLLSQNVLGRLVSGAHFTRRAWSTTLALGAATLACLPTTACAAVVGATAGATLLTGGAVTALVAGSAYLYLAAKHRRQYARVYPTTVCDSKPPRDWNPTASVSKADIGERPVDKVREAVKVVGLASADFVPEVFADNEHNQYKALEKRVLAAPPDHDPVVVQEFLTWAKASCPEVLGAPVAIKSVPFDKWLDGMNASIPVKRRILRAKMALDSVGVDENSVLSKNQLHRATQRESFTKYEAVLSGSQVTKSQKACRLIQGAHPEMTALVGPWMTAFQGRMKRVLDGSKGLMFTSGRTVREVATLVGSKIEQGWKPFDDDVGAYDLSMIVPYAEFEVWLCKRYHCPRANLDLMVANIETHGWTSLGWKYSVRGTRKSGDTFTSVMNSILNLLFHLFIFCKERGIGVKQAMQELVMAAQGDDDVGAHTGAPVDWKAGMAALGFKSEPHYVEQTSSLEFCSHYLTRDSVGWTFFPKVGRILAKAGVSLRAPDGLEAAYARMTVLSLRGACASCPPLRAYCDRVLQLTEGERQVRQADEPWKMKSDEAGVPTPETWVDLYERYGYTIDMHKELEAELRSMELGEPQNLPIYNHLCGVDSGVEEEHNVAPLGRKVDLGECSEDAGMEYVQYLVTLPGATGPVTVDVKDGKVEASVSDVVKMACRKERWPNFTTADVEYFVAGRSVHHAMLPCGQEIVVKARGRGGMLAVVSGLTKPGVWLAKLVLEAAVDTSVYETAERVFNYEEHKERDGVEYVWVDSTPPSVICATKAVGVSIPQAVSDVAALASVVVTRSLIVQMCGMVRVVEVAVDCDVGQAASTAFGFDVGVLSKFTCHLRGKPCRWNDPIGREGDVLLRPIGRGGAQVSRGERLLKKMEDALGVKVTSRPWLMSSFDPMHDNSIGLGSYPDSNGAMSVPMLVRNTMQVSSNSGATAVWDCAIVFNPDANLHTLAALTRVADGRSTGNSNLLTSPAAGPVAGGTWGGVSSYQDVTGNFLNFTKFVNGVSYIPNTSAGGGLTGSKIDGPWRLTALGLEVVNTTAELYKQGTVTVWTQPTPPPQSASTYTIMDFNHMPSTIGFTPSAVSCVLMPSFPGTVAEANILAGSRQWAAAEGCYMVARRSSDTLPPICGQCVYPLYYDNGSTDATVAGPLWANQVIDGGAITTPVMPETSFSPYNMMGATFTGLSAQTTLTVNVWAYIEVFPEQIENVLTPLAQPSAPYDEQALRMYSEIIKAMPVGVMLKENGLGDWFADAIGGVVDTVGSIAGTVGRAAGAVAAGISNWRGSSPQAAVSSAVLRNDGLADMKREERSEQRVAKVERKLERAAAVVSRVRPDSSAKARVLARQMMAADKMRARNQSGALKRVYK